MPPILYEDHLMGIFGISWESDEHKRAKLAMAKAHELTNSIVDTIREPLLVLDHNLHIIMASRSYYEIFGTTQAETEGMCIFDVGNHQWDIAGLRERLHEIIPRALTFENFEVEHDFPLIGRRIMLLNARVIYRKENHSKTMLLAMEDITERREAEKKLKKLREEFLAILTHDMKGPLSSMSGYLELIAKPQFGSISERKINFVKMIRSSMSALLLMINNIVHSSAIENGQMSYVMEDFSLDTMIKELMMSFDALSMISTITMDFCCPEGTLVHGDKEKIRGVFFNLISNAFRYTPSGGTISIKVSHENNHAMVYVSDTGSGIAESEHEKIFKKFARIKGESRGTGLGLYIVKSILQEHGSDIRFESAPEKGTTFIFSLEKAIIQAKVPSVIFSH